MLTRHVSHQLARFGDGQLAPAEAARVEAHLAVCGRCRAERDDILFARALLRQLPQVAAPASVWNGIVAQVDQPMRVSGVGWPRLATATVLLMAVVAATWWGTRPIPAPWEVARFDRNGATVRMAAGEWIETSPTRGARIVVGEIGTVDVGADTRVRLGAMQPDEYRITLARGTISAEISAPPRLFFVETPASTVVDLGCAYTVSVDDAGAGDLRVTQGWASLEWEGRESLVPAGARCQIRPKVGPGTPYFEDAAAALQQALREFDSGAAGGSAALAAILAEARVRDTLTLWHLLSRVAPADRARVYDRIAELMPVPPGVSRERALELDPETLRHWREELAWSW